MEKHDLFLSYRQDTDTAIAIRLQRMVKRIGLPLWSLKRRAVFRDVEGMHAGADTRNSLIEMLKGSRYMALLACPESAQSDWVQCEVAAWLTNFRHTNWMPGKGVPFPLADVDPSRVARLIICHTGGTLCRPAASRDFDWGETDALPQHLQGVFTSGPTWQDLTKRQRDGAVDREVLSLRSAAIAGAISEPPRTTAQILARDRKLWIALMSAAVAAAFALLVSGGLAVYQWHAAEKARRVEQEARQQAELDFQNAKKIVDENFTQIAYNLKDLPGAARLRLELMRKAQEYYTEFLARRSGSALDEGMAVALFNVGLIQLEFGQDAGPQFQEAVAFLETRAAAKPGDIELQRSWAQSLYNLGISALAREQYSAAERDIVSVIAFMARLREKFPNDRHLELDYWNAHLGLASAVANQGSQRLEESVQLFNQGRAGLEQLLEKLRTDSDAELRTILTSMANEDLAGALFNLANSRTLPLRDRMRFGEAAWQKWEELTRQRPTDHQRFFRTAQACRLLASLWKEFGDKGDAQVFAERSLLINHRLALNFTGNDIFKEEFPQDLKFLNALGVWNREAWLDEVAVAALENSYELKLGDASEQKELAHRIALAHLQVASGMLRSYFSTESRPPPPQAQREAARGHLMTAKKYNDISLEDTSAEDRTRAHVVMQLNIPMWLELTN